MIRINYCWKCEEIKENNQTLICKLPADICYILNEYEICKMCKVKQNVNRSNKAFVACDVIDDLFFRLYRYETEGIKSFRKLRHLIKMSNNPYKKEILDFIRKRGNCGMNSYGNEWEHCSRHILELIDCINHMSKFKRIFTYEGFKYENPNVIKNIILEVLNHYFILCPFKYHITEDKVIEYIDQLMNDETNFSDSDSE